MKQKRPQQKTRREKKRFKKKFFIYLFSIFIIIWAFIYAMNHPYLRLGGLRINGQKTLIQSDIESSVRRNIDTKILGIIPRDNMFFFRNSFLESYLKKEFPKINNIEVSVDDAEDIIITICERSAHSLWCLNKEFEFEFNEECYFADETGLLYARAPYFSGNIYLKLFILPEENKQDYIGTFIKDTEGFILLFNFLDQIEQNHSLRIDRVYFNEFNDVKITIARLEDTLYPDKKVYIHYNQSDSYEKILRDIGITLNFKEFREEFAKRSERLESIDVRFDGRIFYTFTPIENQS